MLITKKIAADMETKDAAELRTTSYVAFFISSFLILSIIELFRFPLGSIMLNN
jgi:hypothetical protein